MDGFASTLMEQGVLGLFCAFLIYLHSSTERRVVRFEEKREADQRDLEAVLDAIAGGVEQVLRITKEKIQDEKLEKLVRQGARGKGKTEAH